MMNNLKTVGNSMSIQQNLIQEQHKDVEQMRDQLLYSKLNPKDASTSLKNITLLRAYHQLSRIIRYTEMMDKIEEKLYESIENRLDSIDVNNSSSWMTLIAMQERLMDNMLQSQKLLQPVIDLSEYTIIDEDNSSSTSLSLDASKREKLRTSAREVLLQLNAG